MGLGLVLIWGLPWETLLPGRGFGLLQQNAQWSSSGWWSKTRR